MFLGQFSPTDSLKTIWVERFMFQGFIVCFLNLVFFSVNLYRLIQFEIPYFFKEKTQKLQI